MAAMQIRSLRFPLCTLLLLCAVLTDTAGAAREASVAEPARAPGPGHIERLRIPDNPGLLDAYFYVPQRVAEHPALVVALHGCGQQAADVDDETGWTTLADEAGFILLLPEQSTFNNLLRCFNWFSPLDSERNLGEPESIRHAVEGLLARFPIDRDRIFVTGLSAGGGMTNVLLATHPDLFAGGAVIGGVPYRCARNAFQALPCMQGNRLRRGPQEWAELVREAAPPGHGPLAAGRDLARRRRPGGQSLECRARDAAMDRGARHRPSPGDRRDRRRASPPRLRGWGRRPEGRVVDHAAGRPCDVDRRGERLRAQRPDAPERLRHRREPVHDPPDRAVLGAGRLAAPRTFASRPRGSACHRRRAPVFHSAQIGSTRELALDELHALKAGSYPSAYRDPFDRMLAAQSELEGLPLITRDPAFTDVGTKTLW